MTANCSVDIPAGRYVIVQQNARGDGCLSISEIEIYTYGEQFFYFPYGSEVGYFISAGEKILIVVECGRNHAMVWYYRETTNSFFKCLLGIYL